MLFRSFEARHPGVQVRLHLDTGLELRRMIAAVQNDGRHTVGRGVVHVVAPGGEELLDRLEQKSYVLPDTRRVYAVSRLVVIVPESLVDAPATIEEMARTSGWRLAVADPGETDLGWQTRQALQALGMEPSFRDRLDVAVDGRAVLDHVLRGRADAGVVFSAEAVRERERVRIVTVLRHEAAPAIRHAAAIDRYCPDRNLCREFLEFLRTPEAQSVLRQLGYDLP